MSLLSFTAISFFLSFRCKNLSILTPRCFNEFDKYSLFPRSLVLISSGSTFIGDLKITCSVFSILSEILFAFNYLFNCFLSWFTSLFRFFTELFSWKAFVSSAKWCTLQCWIALWRSLMSFEKRSGPRTELCVIPQFTGIISEL